jgi:CRISPR-associated protein Cmr3
MAEDQSLALMLRDGLFLKDAKGWTTSALGRASTLNWPYPSTIRGALRTAWGLEQEGKHGGKLWEAQDWLTHTEPLRLTAMLPLRRARSGDKWDITHRMWPAPSDAYVVKGEVVPHYLTPTAPADGLGSLGIGEDPALEALWHVRPPEAIGKDKPGKPPVWWTEAEFVAWLCGEQGIRFAERTRDVPARDQVHVTIKSDTGTAADSQLYGTRVIEPLDALGNEWAVGVRVRWPAPLSATPHKLKPISAGGKRRLIYPEVATLWDMPTKLKDAFKKAPQGLRIILATPAEFAQGWLLDGFTAQGTEYRGKLPGLHAELILRAACVPRPVHVSGWDMAARDGKGAPKPTRRLVPAGAVYFFERADNQPFTEADAQALWCAQVGQHREDGQGVIVPGIWHPKH